jgi:hypothetical protein
LTLTRDEVEERELFSDENEPDFQKRKRFRLLLGELKQRFGFDVGSERALVQVFRTKDGGAELFITKLGTLARCLDTEAKASRARMGAGKKRICYIFKDLSCVLRASRAVSRTESPESSLYRLESGEYCLEICTGEDGAERFVSFFEFGLPYKDGESRFLPEHARTVLEHSAIEVLSGI